MYLWFATQGILSAYYPAYVLGLTIGLAWPVIESSLLAQILSLECIVSVYCTHEFFGLKAPSRVWLVLLVVDDARCPLKKATSLRGVATLLERSVKYCEGHFGTGGGRLRVRNLNEDQRRCAMNLNRATMLGLSVSWYALLSGCGSVPDGASETVETAQQAVTTSTFRLPALASGNWNSAGIHTVGNYQIGHSTQLPDQQAAYFEFNLDPIKGRKLVSASVLIPGSTDYNIEVTYPKKCPGTHTPCFKIGIAPQGALSTSEIVNPSSNHNTDVFLQGDDGRRNQDLGYAWVEDGLHKGLAFDADHYNNARLQDEINTGGDWVFWARDDFDSGESNMSNGACPACPGGVENYVWGSTSFNNGIVLIITVQ